MKSLKAGAINDLTRIFEAALEELVEYFKRELVETGMVIPFSDERMLQVYLEAKADPTLAAILTEMFPGDAFATFVDKMEGRAAEAEQEVM
jgi:hypothetical protein